MKKIEELEKDLQTNKLQNIYLLYGEEQFLLEQFIILICGIGFAFIVCG